MEHNPMMLLLMMLLLMMRELMMRKLMVLLLFQLSLQLSHQLPLLWLQEPRHERPGLRVRLHPTCAVLKRLKLSLWTLWMARS